jgi:hypothetical protein
MYAQTYPNVLTINFNYDSLFSLGGFNLKVSDMSKMSNNQFTKNMKNYIKEKAWPTLKRGTRELAGELSPTIKKLFLAAAGLTLVLIGGKIVKEALSTPDEKPDDKTSKHKTFANLSRRTLLCTIGASMVATGIGTILFSDRIAEFFTASGEATPKNFIQGYQAFQNAST